MKNLPERGFAHLLLIILLLLGVLATVFLVQKQQIFKSKASSDPVTFQDANGSSLPKVNNIAQATSSTIKVVLSSTIGPASTASASATTVVSDSFDRVDNSTSLGNAETGQTWSLGNGSTAGTSINQAYMSNCVGVTDDCYAVVDSKISDGTVQVLLSTNPQDSRVIFRYVDGNNMYFVENKGTGYGLYKRVEKVDSELGFFDTTPKDKDVIKIDFTGSTINVSINGTPRITKTDVSFLTRTEHGIGIFQGKNVTKARFDDFTVTAQPSVTSTPGPITTSFYRIAESSTDLYKTPNVVYTSDPTVVSYTFLNTSAGKKFIWARFIGSDNSIKDVGPFEIDLVTTTLDLTQVTCAKEVHPCSPDLGSDHNWAPPGFPGFNDLASWSEIQFGNIIEQDYVTFQNGYNVYRLYNRRFLVNPDPNAQTKFSSSIYPWDDSKSKNPINPVVAVNLNASPFPILDTPQPVRSWSQVLFSNDLTKAVGILQQDLVLGNKIYNRRYSISGIDSKTGNLQTTKIYDWQDANNPAVGVDLSGSNFPGSGNVQAWSQVFIPCTPKCSTNDQSINGVLQQDLVKGNTLYNRQYLVIDNRNAGFNLTPIYGWTDLKNPFHVGINMTSFPGTGDVQAWHQFVVNGSFLQQDFWRSNEFYYRRLKINSVDVSGNVSLKIVPGTLPNGWILAKDANY